MVLVVTQQLQSQTGPRPEFRMIVSNSVLVSGPRKLGGWGDVILEQYSALKKSSYT